MTTKRPALPDIKAPLPVVEDNEADEEAADKQGVLDSVKYWFAELLSKNSSAFADEEAGEKDDFSLKQCCNWGNIRTRLLIMCALDILGSLYGLASANRVRLISPLLNFTGLCFMWLLMIGMGITTIGMVGIVKRNSKLIQIFFYWSIAALVLNLILSCIDLTTIDTQCDFIWNNFDHSAYLEKDKALFARQCQSYAFVFFSVVMVGVAFARLYYVWLIRGFYISITPEHEQYGSYSAHRTSGRSNYSYAPVHSRSAYSGVNSYEEDD